MAKFTIEVESVVDQDGVTVTGSLTHSDMQPGDMWKTVVRAAPWEVQQSQLGLHGHIRMIEERVLSTMVAEVWRFPS